jgi:gliding-associated putative ABC transporter substrate-binding component GldG
LTQHSKKRIGYTTGHNEPALDAMKKASQDIQTQYDLVPVDLGNPTAEIPQDLAALLIIAPEKKFNDTAKYQIDQYIMRGGKAAFLLNTVTASLQQRMTQPVDLGLNDLLENYGVRINNDLVRDAQCANVTVMQQQGQFQFQSQVPFPYIVAASNFSRNNAIVKDLQEVMFYFVSSVDTAAAAAKGLNAEVIVRSSKRSGKSPGFVQLDPMHKYTQDEFSESGIPMAAVVSGSFKSFYEGKSPAAQVAQSPADARIIVVGDGDFINDEYLVGRGNLNFAANIVDYLADDAGLITIRSKNIATSPLDQVSEGTKESVKWSNLFLPPLFVIGYGLLRWRRRMALKHALEKQLA